MDIIFNPQVNEENQYIQLTVKELRAKGYRIHALNDIFSGVKHFKSIKLVHLNWFENVDDRGFLVALRSFFRKMFVLTVIRVSGKPLVWTMHNRAPHEKRLAFFSRMIIRFLIRWSHRIIIHSHQSADILTGFGTGISKKIIYLPHPNFIGSYGRVAIGVERNNTALYLLFIGMVKPYKNVELLIDIVQRFGKQVQLTIAGKVLNPSYQQQIEKQVALAGNVTLLPHFIPDNDIPRLIASADALVLPYDITSSLNSGTAILAFSYEKTVICPEIGTIVDLGKQRDDVFYYRYRTAAEHQTALHNQIMRALLLKQEDPTQLHAMGHRLRGYMATVHDRRQVGMLLDKTYRMLIENA